MRKTRMFVRFSAALAIGGALCSLAGPASAANLKALTFGATWLKPVLASAPSNATIVGCQALPAPTCNPYTGDTPKTTNLAILCFVPGTAPPPSDYNAYYQSHFNPAGKASSDWHFYYNWSGGKIGLTAQIPTAQIVSQAAADNFCKSATQGLNDPNARMLEFHDNGVGGWNVSGTIHPNSHTPNLLKSNAGVRRFWVRSNDLQFNPWN